MGAVALTVETVTAGGVEADLGATTEVGVVRVDAGVDDVRRGARTVGLRGVRTVQGQVLLVDPVQAPGDHGGDLADLLDVGDTVLSPQVLDLGLAQRGRVTVEGLLVGVVHLVLRDAEGRGGHRGRADRVLQHDDPVAGGGGVGVDRREVGRAGADGPGEGHGDGERADRDGADRDPASGVLLHAVPPYEGDRGSGVRRGVLTARIRPIATHLRFGHFRQT